MSDCFVTSMHCGLRQKYPCIDIVLQCKYAIHIGGYINLCSLLIALRLIPYKCELQSCHLVYVHCLQRTLFYFSNALFLPLRRGHANLLSIALSLIYPPH